MAEQHPRLHGDEALNDPSLADSLCPTCNQRREWKIIQQNENDYYIKECTKCGTKVKVKKMKPPTTPSTPSETNSSIDKPSGLRRILPFLGSKK